VPLQGRTEECKTALIVSGIGCASEAVIRPQQIAGHYAARRDRASGFRRARMQLPGVSGYGRRQFKEKRLSWSGREKRILLLFWKTIFIAGSNRDTVDGLFRTQAFDLLDHLMTPQQRDADVVFLREHLRG